MASKPVCPMARVGMVAGVQQYGGLLYCLVPQGQDCLSGYLTPWDMTCCPNGAYMHSWVVMKRGL
jgi:hypothetical protein